MADTAYNPQTNEAVRLEGNEWIPTDVATNPETGEVAIFDGKEWVIRKRETTQTKAKPAVATESTATPAATPVVPETPTVPQATDVEKEQPNWLMRNIFGPIGLAQMEMGEAQEKAGAITAKAAIETVTAPVEIGKLIISEETAQTIADSPVGQRYTAIKNTLDPKLNEDEALAAEILTMFTLGGAGKKLAQESLKYIFKKKGKKKADEIAAKVSQQTGLKVTPKADLKPTKGQQKALKATGIFGTVAGATQAEVQFTPRERETLVDTIASIPSVRETLPSVVVAAADALKVNPEDTDAQATLKQYGAVITQNTALLGVLKGLGLGAKGIGKAVGSERLAKINTGLGDY